MAMRSIPSDASSALAFTLVELLVSSAIMTVFVGIILYLATALLNSWNRATGILSTNYEARISLDYLAQDLSGAILRHDGDPWLISEDAENIEGIRNTVWLRFFTAAPDRDRAEPGEVTAVSYRLLYLNPLNPSKATGKTAALYRTVINGRRTFEEFLGQLAVRAEEDFLPLQQGALSSSFLGGNIVSFRVVFTILEPDEVGNLGPVRLGGLARVEFPFARAAKPASADVSLTVLTDEGARLYEARNSGLDVGLTMEEIVDRHGRVFTRRVPLLAEAM